MPLIQYFFFFFCYLVISSDDDYNTIQKGIINGACDFLVKPIPMEALKMVWKYVVCKRRMTLEEVQKQQLWNVGHYYGDVHLRLPYRDHQHNILPLNEGIKRLKRGTDGDEDECKASGDHDHVVGAKKSRMIWTADLHHKFVAIVNELGLKSTYDQSFPNHKLDDDNFFLASWLYICS